MKKNRMKKNRIKITEFRTINIRVDPEVIKQAGFWRVLWGTDIFINDIPVLKSFALCNLIFWLVVWLVLK